MEESSLGAPLLLGQHSSLSSPGCRKWHILPAWAAEPLQKTPSSFQGWEEKDPLEFECGTATKCWQDTGIPGGWQAMAVLREGVSGEALHPQDALSTVQGAACREQEEDNPSVVRNEEHALRVTLQALLSLAPKPKPAPGQEDGITKAETSVQHWVRSNSPKEKNC